MWCRKGIRAYARMARARGWFISRVARTRHVRVRASGVVPKAQRWRGIAITLWKMYEMWNFSIHAYARMARVRGWSKMHDVRVRMQCAYAWMVLCFFKIFFYVFAPIQAFQTSKQLPKHHKTLFNILKLPNILN